MYKKWYTSLLTLLHSGENTLLRHRVHWRSHRFDILIKLQFLAKRNSESFLMDRCLAHLASEQYDYKFHPSESSTQFSKFWRMVSRNKIFSKWFQEIENLKIQQFKYIYNSCHLESYLYKKRFFFAIYLACIRVC